MFLAIETIGVLSEEDLSRFRTLEVRRTSYEVRPDAYSREEIEQNEMAIVRFLGEIYRRFGLDDSRLTSVNVYTGTISYESDG